MNADASPGRHRLRSIRLGWIASILAVTAALMWLGRSALIVRNRQALCETIEQRHLLWLDFNGESHLGPAQNPALRDEIARASIEAELSYATNRISRRCGMHSRRRRYH